MQMKTLPGRHLIVALLALLVAVAAHTARADDAAKANDTKTYMVQEGAFPWYDRVGNWSLTNVPASLKDTGPLPQGSCSSRSLDIAGSPKSILVAVQNNDTAKFMTKVPGAKATTDTIAVKNSSGTTIDYTIYSVPNPPAKIDGTGVFGAGLILLKVEPGDAKKADK
jgi:hypothetical protein